jgi:hypothetical protein
VGQSSVVGRSSIDHLPSYFEVAPRPELRQRRRHPRTVSAGTSPPAGVRVDRQFIRVVNTPPDAAIAAVGRRWQAPVRGGRLLGPPVATFPGGPAIVPVGLRRPFGPVLVMELELGPWLLAGTRLDLRPARHVRASRRYFRSGHALLDAVVARIEAGAGGSTPPARH